ncbi:MAG: linear amide C-N hydrolase [bacterium]
MKTKNIFPGILFLTISLIYSCQDDSMPGPIIQYNIDTVKSLESLSKVDDYPFYTMTIYGDYGFSDYLQIGSGNSAVIQKDISGDKYKCTCFASWGDGGNVFGRNFDWRHHEALLLFTDPSDGYASAAMIDMFYLFNRSNAPLTTIEDRQPLLNAPYYSFDGMNEMGVSIGIMAVDHAEPTTDPAKITINDLDVVRLVLDYAANANEALELIEKYNIKFWSVPLHYLIADKNGNSVIVEFINTEVKTFFNTDNYQVCTNFLIDENKSDLSGNCWRYDLAVETLSNNNGNLSSNTAMDLLDQVSQSNTMWSLVYDLTKKEVFAVTDRKYNSVYKFTLPGK